MQLFFFVAQEVQKLKLHISQGNMKMGSIPSVSLPSVLTCRKCLCNIKCYSRKLEKLRPNVSKAYQENFDLFIHHPEQYWREVEACIMLNQYFRFHVGGDIVNYQYFLKMVEIAQRNPQCSILCFTKKDYIINMYIRDYGELPNNLHIVLSAWKDLTLHNPYQLPEAHVIYRDGTTTTHEDVIECKGNCTECAIEHGGCWNLKHGERIKFHEH